jgi:hypothetical protein
MLHGSIQLTFAALDEQAIYCSGFAKRVEIPEQFEVSIDVNHVDTALLHPEERI